MYAWLTSVAKIMGLLWIFGSPELCFPLPPCESHSKSGCQHHSGSRISCNPVKTNTVPEAGAINLQAAFLKVRPSIDRALQVEGHGVPFYIGTPWGRIGVEPKTVPMRIPT